MKYLPYEEAKKFVHKLGLKSSQEWNVYCKSGKKPANIPRSAPRTYENQWMGWGDWLGTVTLAERQFRPFLEAKSYAISLGFRNRKQWHEYARAGNIPSDVPVNPHWTYREQWKGWGDWLGTGTIRPSDKIFRQFQDARAYSRSLGIRNKDEWGNYCRSDNKPPDIPSLPPRTYKAEWRGWKDWLGTENVKRKRMVFRKFDLAREYIHALHLKRKTEWSIYSKSKKKPIDIPSNPARTYPNEWRGWKDWLGTGITNQDRVWGRTSEPSPEWRKFEVARALVRSLNLKNKAHWKECCKLEKLPHDIPSYPPRAYGEKWKGWKDWLGLSDSNIEFENFEDARRSARKLGLRSSDEWKKYYKSGKLAPEIPASPSSVYKDDWKGWGDWLGTGRIANFQRKYLTFIEARKFARSLDLKSSSQWQQFCKSGKKPADIPYEPNETYSGDWSGWGDWLGTVTSREIQFRSFEDARQLVRSLQLRNRQEFAKYCKSDTRPKDIPTKPSRTYGKLWKGWGDWLGTGTIATWQREYLPFNEAREFVRSLKLQHREEWDDYVISGNKPANIPAGPWYVYKKEWAGIFDWLGYEEKLWSAGKVKELLQDMIKSGVIYSWDEAVLYSLLLRKGLLNLYTNRHRDFFRGLIKAARTVKGMKLVEEYVNSDSVVPPDLSGNQSEKVAAAEDELQTASPEELALVKNQDPLDYGKDVTVEQILKQTDILDSINVDEEAIQFYLNYSIDELWKLAFKNKKSENDTVLKLKLAGKQVNKYRDTVIETFLKDYEGSRSIKLPTDYRFPSEPTLMQYYVAFKVKNNNYFGNFSATGSGKTLSAILASRVTNSKMTVIVCPNDVVDQWRRSILEVFPNSKVVTGKGAFFLSYSESEYKYLVLNYDKFSQEESPNLILNLGKQKIDFIVLDEIHFTKIRDEDEISKRRRNLDGLMTLIRRKNPNVKILGLSATPVVNNLREGKSMLELLTGKVYDDVSTKPTIPNAVTLYEKLSTISIRELPKYSADLDTQVVNVIAPAPSELTVKHLKTNPLAIEKLLTVARLPEIIKLIDGQTIIYTEYVEDIVKKIAEAVENAGYSFALYTGFDRSGKTKFLDKKVQVLIASRPLSVGVDGLQHICNRLILNTLPWTNAQYQQLLGRLVRKGQIRDVVHVYLIKASIGGYEYDELKWKRIQFKRTLADCAVDGVLPEKNLVTPQQAAMEAIKWLERLEHGDISTVVRQDLNVELAPVEIKKRIAKFGDFSRLNNRINNENSETTHHRMTNNPIEWEEYHRQYRESRKTWNIIPYEEIVKRIKQLSPRLMIGDFGCGEATIQSEFGDRVYSFDHIAINNKVTACDMKSTGLPDEAIDIAIFSLSLMGRNWDTYIAEAKRCLATGGYLLVTDTTKSLKGRLSNLRDIIKKQGFEIYSDEEKGDFTFIEAREL